MGKSSSDDNDSDSKSSSDDSDSDSKSSSDDNDEKKVSKSTRNVPESTTVKKNKRDFNTINSFKSSGVESMSKASNLMNSPPESKNSNRKDDDFKYSKFDAEENSKKRKSTTIVEEKPECKKRAAVEDGNDNLRMYIRGLPWRATEDEVREYFSTCGEITSIEMPIMDDGRSSGTAIIDFKTKEACESCLELNGSDFNGRWLNIKYSTPKPIWSPREPSEKAEGCTTVFVGNLSFQIDEETLRDAFGDCGEITQVRFAEDRETGHFKGFGHIEFANTESTNLAVKMTGTDIMGRPVRVDYCKSKKKEFCWSSWESTW